MNSYKQRVIDEKAELDAKAEKLAAFIGSEIWRGLPEMDGWLLSEQLEVMRHYSRILGARIERFSIKSPNDEAERTAIAETARQPEV